jgi:mono/diheme cytochrome c family protein
MFVVYALLGLLVFVLLDAPAMREVTGRSAIVALVIFYVACSAVYVAAAHLLPQYDPEWEKGKIKKILDAKKAAHTTVSNQELAKQATELSARTEELMERLATLEEAVTGKSSTSLSAEDLARKRAESAKVASAGTQDPVAYGREVYDLYECYNCHKIGGKGSTKKRGPILDNIGNLLTAEQIAKKIFDPEYLYAEGFEKEHKKKLMPDNYPELMSEEELHALAAYLVTLKEASAKTPKPIFEGG